MELLTPRLALREFRDTDFCLFHQLETQPETYCFESAQPDDAQIRTYLENSQNDVFQTPRTRYRFAVTLSPADLVRGRVTLTLLNASIREWEIGWALHPDFCGRGLATEAAHRLLEFAMVTLGVHRVVAFSHAQNTASLRVMQKLGMQQEAHLRETRHWRGGWADEVVFSILEREWR